jgi:hypothetical protein
MGLKVWKSCNCVFNIPVKWAEILCIDNGSSDGNLYRNGDLYFYDICFRLLPDLESGVCDIDVPSSEIEPMLIN